ncbi:MAG: methionine--tRNA ligase [Microscillaceae bacterium]|jgi:methionyl-tRNA synthetase|nr:methionine--tRNA ligase [Microscillaceae bacterium]
MPNKAYKRHLVTAALPYANGPVHIGHLAGVYVPADIYVRYRRLKGEDVVFVCGSDEHGVPVTIRAEKEGITVQEVVDKYHNQIKKSFADFGIAFDIYSRTSNQIHHETSQEIFKKLIDNQTLISQNSAQYFDPIKEKFLADRYIVGECPVCHNPNAYGDQCEKCGSTLTPDMLINPRSALSEATPIKKDTSHWYLPLDKYEDWLKEWILENHKEDWKNNVYGQCKSWIDGGLQPRPMTRDLDWGIKVPLPDSEGKVLYVWFDAPIGYISATKEYFSPQTPGRGFKSVKSNDWETYWQSEDTKLVHFIGKDNIVFHCIIFPVILHAEGSYILPDNVPANEFLNLEGDKISTSRNWAVWLHEYLEAFPDKQDVLRYVLCANAPETKDNDFTWKDFQARNNNELVAVLGNFVNRAVTLTERNFESKIPELGELQTIDNQLISDLKEFPAKIGESIENYRFREALGYYLDLARVGNKYLQDNEPWKVIKEDKNRVATVLHLSLQIVANLAILGEPFLPHSAEKIRKMLNLNELAWNFGGKIDLLKPNAEIQNTGLLFEKIEDSVIEAQIQKLLDTKKNNEVAQATAKFKPMEQKEEITYDDFTKIDIRIATVLTAENVKGSKKLLKLSLDTGIDQRTVLSGIAEHFTPEQVVGKQVCVLINLAPRKMMGMESQGMVLLAENADGKLVFVTPTDLVSNGVVVK